MPDAATSPLLAAEGWLYQLLRWAGVGDPTASHVQQVLVKPISVVIVLVVAVAVGWIGNRVIRRWIGSAVRHAASRADSPRAERRAVTLTTMVANIWRVVVALVAVFVALGTIGVNLTPVLAGATIVGATIGFGAQSMVRDLLAGFLITVEGQFDIGDTVAVGDTEGVVEDLTLRVTRLRAPDGTVWYVPNGEIRRLGNTARGWGRATVDVPVAPGADLDRLLGALEEAGATVHDDTRYAAAFLEAPVQWGVVDVGVDHVTARVTARTTADQRDRVERAIRAEVLRRLDGQLPAPPPPT